MIQIHEGYVYAIENKSKNIDDIDYNIQKFNCANKKVLNRALPGGVDEIKSTPDRIFIGEGGKNLKQRINRSCEKLAPSGVIVINAVLIQILSQY